MGDVIGDLNSRRGLINKFEDKPGGMKVVQVSTQPSGVPATALSHQKGSSACKLLAASPDGCSLLQLASPCTHSSIVILHACMHAGVLKLRLPYAMPSAAVSMHVQLCSLTQSLCG